MESWYVAQTLTGHEAMVQQRLEASGLKTYLPRIKAEDRPIALFPGYLIVQPIVQWSAIRWTPGVVRLLMAGDHPAPLSGQTVHQLQKREYKGFIHMPKPKSPPGLHKGQTIRVIAGSFVGLNGLVEGMAGRERVRILLSLLGQAVPVDMPSRNVEPLRLPDKAFSRYKP